MPRWRFNNFWEDTLAAWAAHYGGVGGGAKPIGKHAIFTALSLGLQRVAREDHCRSIAFFCCSCIIEQICCQDVQVGGERRCCVGQVRSVKTFSLIHGVALWRLN